MAIRDIFKVSRKTFIYPSAWMDLENVKNQNKTIWRILKDLFTPVAPERTETFEEAMVRLELTEEDVTFGAQRYRQYALFFSGLGLLLFFYTFYLLFRYFTITGWMLGLAVSILCFTQAFKYDFWSLQMRRRKLGITFKEWRESIFNSSETLS